MRRRMRQSDCPLEEPSVSTVSSLNIPTEPVLTRNGRASKALAKDESGRKSEKERRKNERKQESKAAKTLSAILFAFIATWTPYNCE